MVDTIILDNGVTVVMEEIPFVRSISFGIFVKNGSRNESEKLNGISHFIEHMMFKGTENRTAKMIADEMDSVGGQINAYTTKEYTCYYTRTLDTHFDTALDVLSDMYFNSKFDDVEIKKELNVILEEISMYEDTPEDLVYDKLQYNVWKNNSIGLPILGTSDVISKFNHDTFKKYYEEHYRPDNTVLAIAGNFKKEEIIEKIKKYFENWHCGNKINNDFGKVDYFKSSIKTEKDIEQLHLSLCFPSISIGDEASYALTIVNTIFGGGMSSRLFQRIREENGLAYSVYSFGTSYIDTGLFNIYAGLNANQYSSVKNLIFEEIENLKKNGISLEQLNKTKEQIKSNFLLSLESSSSRMSSIGKSKLLLNKIKTPEEIILKVDAVDLDKVGNIIESVFDMEKASISLVGKVSGIEL